MKKLFFSLVLLIACVVTGVAQTPVTGSRINIKEQASAPSNPASGTLTFWSDTSNVMHVLASDGTDISLGSGGGVDPFFDQTPIATPATPASGKLRTYIDNASYSLVSEDSAGNVYSQGLAIDYSTLQNRRGVIAYWGNGNWVAAAAGVPETGQPLYYRAVGNGLNVTSVEAGLIGNNDIPVPLSLVGNADVVQFTVTANGTQTSPVSQVKRSDGTVIYSLDNNGDLIFGLPGGNGGRLHSDGGNIYIQDSNGGATAGTNLYAAEFRSTFDKIAINQSKIDIATAASIQFTNASTVGGTQTVGLAYDASGVVRVTDGSTGRGGISALTIKTGTAGSTEIKMGQASIYPEISYAANFDTNNYAIQIQAGATFLNAQNQVGIRVGNVPHINLDGTTVTISKPTDFWHRTTTERDALTPSEGWTIYNTTTHQNETYNGTIWVH